MVPFDDTNQQTRYESFMRIGELHQAQMYVRALLALVKNDQGTTFLTNPAAFRRLQKLAAGDHITAIAGDLGGTSTMAAIARKLEEKNIEVSVFDPSNALDYVPAGEAKRNFLANLKSLPFAVGAVVNFTNWQAEYKNGFREFVQRLKLTTLREDAWDYLSVPATEFIAAAEHFVEAGTYKRYTYDLVETNANLLLREARHSSCQRLFLN